MHLSKFQLSAIAILLSPYTFSQQCTDFSGNYLMAGGERDQSGCHYIGNKVEEYNPYTTLSLARQQFEEGSGPHQVWTSRELKGHVGVEYPDSVIKVTQTNCHTLRIQARVINREEFPLSNDLLKTSYTLHDVTYQLNKNHNGRKYLWNKEKSVLTIKDKEQRPNNCAWRGFPPVYQCGPNYLIENEWIISQTNADALNIQIKGPKNLHYSCDFTNARTLKNASHYDLENPQIPRYPAHIKPHGYIFDWIPTFTKEKIDPTALKLAGRPETQLLFLADDELNWEMSFPIESSDYMYVRRYEQGNIISAIVYHNQKGEMVYIQKVNPSDFLNGKDYGLVDRRIDLDQLVEEGHLQKNTYYTATAVTKINREKVSQPIHLEPQVTINVNFPVATSDYAVHLISEAQKKYYQENNIFAKDLKALGLDELTTVAKHHFTLKVSQDESKVAVIAVPTDYLAQNSRYAVSFIGNNGQYLSCNQGTHTYNFADTVDIESQNINQFKCPFTTYKINYLSDNSWANLFIEGMSGKRCGVQLGNYRPGLKNISVDLNKECKDFTPGKYRAYVSYSSEPLDLVILNNQELKMTEKLVLPGFDESNGNPRAFIIK